MGIQNLTQDVVLVTLPSQPHAGSDLEFVTRLTRSNRARDVIVNFSLVEMMPSSTICQLMVLERALNEVGHQLVLCSLPTTILGIFRRVGLHGLFRFADDEFAALQSLEGRAPARRE
jgi:anti-anti-sigma regulatory factor